MSELLLSPPEGVPVNQSSISCNDQAGQHTLVDNNDSIQQTTQFPASFPQTMTTMGGLDGTSSSWINQHGPNWPQTAPSEQQWTNQLPTSNQVPGMLPQPPMNQCSRQFPYQSNQVPITPNLYDPQCSTTLPEPSQTLKSPQFPPHNLQVSGDHNQGQNENHSSGPDSSLQSQNRGLNTQQVKRVRPNDQFWQYVEDMNDGKKKCKFCKQKIFAKGTPITRIKWHLSGETGHGVDICAKVPKDVQEAAFLALPLL